MKPVDLTDWEPIVTKFRVVGSEKGSGGSFFEPASAPSETIEVQEIEIENLDPKHFDEESIAEVVGLKSGDLIKMKVSFEDGNTYEVDGTSKVKSVHFDEKKKVVKIGCAFTGEWVGDKPAQSDAGRG